MVATNRRQPDPDTTPDSVNGELVEAIEWLRRAGILHPDKPAFSGFFDEVAASGEGDAEP